MPKKPKKNPAAVALGKKRWEKLTAEERHKIASKGGKTAGRGRPKKKAE